MEQPHHSFWRSKLMFMNSAFDRPSSSWEEKAFAEDHHGGINGGCVWPPRSYSCSFCKREFRSAQALGGHMNVHRKDRARLKQSSSPDHPHHHYQTNDFCVKPNDDDLHSVKSSDSYQTALSSSSSRVSALSATQNFSSYYYFLKKQKGFDESVDPKPEVVKNPRSEEASSTCLSAKNGSNLVGTNEIFSSKRAKTEILTISLSKPCSNNRCGLQSEAPVLFSSSMEDVDLELRLGRPPEVN